MRVASANSIAAPKSPRPLPSQRSVKIIDRRHSPVSNCSRSSPAAEREYPLQPHRQQQHDNDHPPNTPLLMIRFRNWRLPNEKTQGRISPGVNRPWNSSLAEGTDDRPLCSAIPNRPVLVGCRCSDRRNHRHIADRRSVNANVGFGASSSESRMSLPSLWPSDTKLRNLFSSDKAAPA